MEEAILSWAGTPISGMVFAHVLAHTAREIFLGRYRLYSVVSQYNYVSRGLELCHRMSKCVAVINDSYERLLRIPGRFPAALAVPGTILGRDEGDLAIMAANFLYQTRNLTELAIEARSLTSPFISPIEIGASFLAIGSNHDDSPALLGFALRLFLPILDLTELFACPVFMHGLPLSISQNAVVDHYADLIAACGRIQIRLPNPTVLGEAVALGSVTRNNALRKVINLARGVQKTYAYANSLRVSCLRHRVLFSPEYNPHFVPMVFCTSVRRCQMRLLRVAYFQAGRAFVSSLPCIYPEVAWSNAYGTNFRRNIAAHMFQTRYPVDWRFAQIELLLATGGSLVHQDRLHNFQPGDVFHLFFSHDCLDNVDLGCPTGSLHDLNLVHSFPFPLIDDTFLLSAALPYLTAVDDTHN